MKGITFLILFLCSVPIALAGQYRATIHRDSFGVPYIVAETLADAAFGDGYAQAEDRFQLLMDNIQMANGTRARARGQKFVRQDYTSRLIGARRLAYDGWDKQTAEMRAIFQAFAAGVNQFMEDNKGQLPKTVYPVEPQEVLALMRYISLGRQFAQANKDRAGQGQVPIAGEGAPQRSDNKSNGWVLAPSRTVSGNPILLTDPHTPWNGINRWYEKHYITPEANIYGASTIGIPIFIFATTDKLAWTLTRNPGDRGDCFTIKVNPDNPDQYILDGKTLDFKKIEETIEVAAGSQSKQVKRTIYETIHGPVFARDGNTAFAAGLSLYDAELGVEQLLRMALASNIEEFRQAAAMLQFDGANVFCADVKGNIFYGWLNRLMVRNDEYDWQKAVDGSIKKTLYDGVLPFEKMPQSMNDPGGYYQASNTADWALEGGAWGIKPSDFPNWLLMPKNRKYFSASILRRGSCQS